MQYILLCCAWTRIFFVARFQVFIIIRIINHISDESIKITLVSCSIVQYCTNNHNHSLHNLILPSSHFFSPSLFCLFSINLLNVLHNLSVLLYCGISHTSTHSPLPFTSQPPITPQECS